MTYRNLFISMLVIAASAAVLIAADFDGVWTAAIETQVGVQNYTFTFKVDGAKLTGKAKSAFANAETEITEGVVKGDDISFVENLVYEGMPLRITYKGKISGAEIKFKREGGQGQPREFTAKKAN